MAAQYMTDYTLLNKITLKFYRSDWKAENPYKIYKCDEKDCKFLLKQVLADNQTLSRFYENQISHQHPENTIAIGGMNRNILVHHKNFRS